LKEPLHGWLRRLTWLELRAVLVLLAMSFLLLPVLPNRTIDPWDAINPAEIWLLAVLIAGVSFVGYVAVKCLGDQAGIAVAALAGGLTSSTATTLSFARLAREQPQASLVLAGGILLAGMVMIVRVVAIAVALAPTLSSELLVPAAAGALVLLAAGASLTLARRQAGGGETATLELKNPFDLAAALKLAALIAIIMLLAKVLSSMSSTRGLYLLAAVSGIADLDPITLSMARVAGARVAPAEAATAIIIAVGTNTAAKAVMATAIAGRRVGIAVGACSAVAIIAIAAAHLLAPRLSFAESMAAGNALASFERCGNEPMRPFRCKVAAQRLSSLENMAPRRHVRA
jgi:uncharacterized membrane protein (DUF4010 family)